MKRKFSSLTSSSSSSLPNPPTDFNEAWDIWIKNANIASYEKHFDFIKRYNPKLLLNKKKNFGLVSWRRCWEKYKYRIEKDDSVKFINEVVANEWNNIITFQKQYRQHREKLNHNYNQKKQDYKRITQVWHEFHEWVCESAKIGRTFEMHVLPLSLSDGSLPLPLPFTVPIYLLNPIYLPWKSTLTEIEKNLRRQTKRNLTNVFNHYSASSNFKESYPCVITSYSGSVMTDLTDVPIMDTSLPCLSSFPSDPIQASYIPWKTFALQPLRSFSVHSNNIYVTKRPLIIPLEIKPRENNNNNNNDDIELTWTNFLYQNCNEHPCAILSINPYNEYQKELEYILKEIEKLSVVFSRDIIHIIYEYFFLVF